MTRKLPFTANLFNQKSHWLLSSSFNCQYHFIFRDRLLINDSIAGHLRVVLSILGCDNLASSM